MSKLIDGIKKQNKNVGLYFDWDMEDLLAHARALEDVLRKHEWDGYNESWTGTEEYCTECGCDKPAHYPDCALAKLLE